MGTDVSKFPEQLGGVHQNHPQERKVYAAGGFLRVLDQEGGVVPSAPKYLVHRSKEGPQGSK